MPFVNRSGDEESQDVEASGAPPIDFDPFDPDQIKVHYDCTGWDFDQRADLSEALAQAAVPHAWDDDELVVPEVVEATVDAIFDRLEAEIGPFPVALAADEPGTEFGLDEWPPSDVATLRAALIDAEIPHRWEGASVVVATDAEDDVDDLLDAIEAGEVSSLADGDDDGPPEAALHTLHTVADRLVRDASDATARNQLFDLLPQLDPRQPPFGVTVRVWSRALESAREIFDEFHGDGLDPDRVAEHAGTLRTITRPFV